MRKNFEIIKGDTLAFAVEIGFDENPNDLEEASFTVKRNADGDNLFQKKLNHGITKVASMGNKLYYRIRISPWDTKQLEGGFYYYDLEIRINGDVFTILNGLFIIENDITEY
ncbi:hypothetical protein LDB17_017 [Lactobacillus phage Ld17]|uniref:BppU N-terminal domain-containing protein n=1 Tax=Lactobacillus phage Ld17 TaxID=1500733 RepID=A0A075KL48_9CAUD|nr:hypothetical protein LDB17_017 [Lactobacillus phage Ld17]AIF54392.1 hypothetical protein LDB17_017 [Lactobacillus phage Ld17]